MLSAVVTTRAFAWKPRSAPMRLMNSSPKSTFDSSSELDSVRPKPELSGLPIRGVPESPDSYSKFFPALESPSVLLKRARATWARLRNWPLEKRPITSPVVSTDSP